MFNLCFWKARRAGRQTQVQLNRIPDHLRNRSYRLETSFILLETLILGAREYDRAFALLKEARVVGDKNSNFLMKLLGDFLFVPELRRKFLPRLLKLLNQLASNSQWEIHHFFCEAKWVKIKDKEKICFKLTSPFEVLFDEVRLNYFEGDLDSIRHYFSLCLFLLEKYDDALKMKLVLQEVLLVKATLSSWTSGSVDIAQMAMRVNLIALLLIPEEFSISSVPFFDNELFHDAFANLLRSRADPDAFALCMIEACPHRELRRALFSMVKEILDAFSKKSTSKGINGVVLEDIPWLVSNKGPISLEQLFSIINEILSSPLPLLPPMTLNSAF